MPASWTAANLTFQGSDTEAGTYSDLYDDAGTEISVTAAASRTIVGSTLDRVVPLRFLKVRSGTTATPVNQAAARTVLLVMKD